MSTISASTTSTTGFKVTSDTTGTLVLQTGASPTTALTLSSSQVMTLPNDASISGLTVGKGAGAVSTNTAVGASALAANTTGATSVAVGNLAAQTNSTGSNITAVGYKALNLTTVDNNTAVGMQAGRDTSTGTNNVFVGKNCSVFNTTGSSLVAVGVDALFSNTTASNNTAVGYQALYTNSTGAYNIAIGNGALYSNTTYNYNTAVGYGSGNVLNGGSYSVFVGLNSGGGVTTGDRNVLVGANSGLTTLGNYNVGLGFGVLGSATTTGNTALGYNAGSAVTSGGVQTLVGYLAGASVTTGTDNTFLGANAGYSTTATTTGSANIYIGSASRGSAASNNKEIVIGFNLSGQGSNTVSIGSDNGKVYNSFTVNATWTQTSDGRMKTNVVEDSLGLSFINRLRPVKFTWKPSNELDPSNPYYAEENKRDTTTVIHGLIAQDVKAALDAEGVSTFAGWDEGPDGIQAISREMFITPLIKAIQEQQAIIETLTNRITALEAK